MTTTDLPTKSSGELAGTWYGQYLKASDEILAGVPEAPRTTEGANFIVYVSQNTPATERESCRHAVHAGSIEDAADKALQECRLTVYDMTIVVEVFVHRGTELRYRYMLRQIS